MIKVGLSSDRLSSEEEETLECSLLLSLGAQRGKVMSGTQ